VSYQNEEADTRDRRPYLSNGFDSFHDILDYAHANSIIVRVTREIALGCSNLSVEVMCHLALRRTDL
jgi:hypothetical protein